LRTTKRGPEDAAVDDPEATTLVLETLFDIRGTIYEIYNFLIDDEEETEENT
jgi:hypothetical protein